MKGKATIKTKINQTFFIILYASFVFLQQKIEALALKC